MLSGSGFDLIPSDAVGVIALTNDAPLANINTERDDWLFDLTNKTSTDMVFDQKILASHDRATYLGAIVSADRQTVYWVNESRPLPRSGN